MDAYDLIEALCGTKTRWPSTDDKYIDLTVRRNAKSVKVTQM